MVSIRKSKKWLKKQIEENNPNMHELHICGLPQNLVFNVKEKAWYFMDDPHRRKILSEVPFLIDTEVAKRLSDDEDTVKNPIPPGIYHLKSTYFESGKKLEPPVRWIYHSDSRGKLVRKLPCQTHAQILNSFLDSKVAESYDSFPIGVRGEYNPSQLTNIILGV
ncbi:MAG: hypothetical protein WC533_01965 [Candidatus Pacearchaeota archaeon]